LSFSVKNTHPTAGLGFQHEECFSLDEIDETHISAWQNGEHGRSSCIFP
jgi:hypothetical protein